ncbi:putative mitochondrial protein, partial [Mucuna pruriens]
MVTFYFEEACPIFCLRNFFPSLPNHVLQDLGKGNIKVKEALFAMGNFKAPEEDGLQPIFFIKLARLVGSTVCSLKKSQGSSNSYLSIFVMFPTSFKVLAQRFKGIMESLVNPVIGLPKNLVDLIWTCISTPSMRVIWTDKLVFVVYRLSNKLNLTNTHHLSWTKEALQQFTLSKGIRQGDALSPYLFVLCLERSSQLIELAIENKFWKPICLSREGPKLPHLAFADDIIVFAEANLEQAKIINSCHQLFCSSSSSFCKSMAWQLAPHAPYILDDYDSILKVVEVATIDGNWNWEWLLVKLTRHIVDIILTIMPPRRENDPYILIWKHTSHGNFSLFSAYDFWAKHNVLHNYPTFRIIWTWTGTKRVRCLLWKIVNNGLPTNSLRAHRGINNSAMYLICLIQEESLIHTLRDGTKSVIVDSGSKTCNIGFSQICNVTIIMVVDDLFSLMLHGRGEMIRSSLFLGPLISTFLSPPPRLVRWISPKDGFTKINYDGSFSSTSGLVAAGGIFIDCQSCFIAAFTCKLGHCTIVKALWAIFHGSLWLEVEVSINGVLRMAQ